MKNGSRVSHRTGAVMALALAVGLTATAGAAVAKGQSKSLNGCYIPTKGFAESTSVNPAEQVGLYRIVLERENWEALSGKEKKSTTRKLVMEGPFRGVITSPQPILLDHVLADEERRGVVYTQGDDFMVTGVECEGGIISGIETLRPVLGTGRYENLLPGGTVQVEGSVNNCPGDPDFGTNDFEVVEGGGVLCFN